MHPPLGGPATGRGHQLGELPQVRTAAARFNNTFEGRDRANNSDIFVENTTTWRPNWRTESIEPRAREAYEASKLAGVSV